MISDEKERFVVVAAGRLFGKTTRGKAIIIKKAREEGLRCLWVSPNSSMARRVWSDLKFLTSYLTGVIIREDERRIDFLGGGMLIVRSAYNVDTLRGVGLDFAVLDEAAYMEPHIWSNVVLPCLGDKGRALLLSTPNGRNWFWEAWLKGLYEDEWRSFRFTSFDGPVLGYEVLMDTMPVDFFRRAYLAEFVDD